MFCRQFHNRNERLAAVNHAERPGEAHNLTPVPFGAAQRPKEPSTTAQLALRRPADPDPTHPRQPSLHTGVRGLGEARGWSRGPTGLPRSEVTVNTGG